MLEGPPATPPTDGWALPAAVLLATAGTLLPFTLFAFGQSRIAPQLAGAFLNLEPLVGALAGAAAFGDAFGPVQLAGGFVLLAGIALSALPRPARSAAVPARAVERSHHAAERIRVPATQAGHRRVLARRERPPSPRRGVRSRSDPPAPACSSRGMGRGRPRPRPRAAPVHQSGQITAPMSRSSCHRSTNDGRPENQSPVVDLVDDHPGLRTIVCGIVGSLSGPVLVDVEVLLDDAPGVFEERPLGADRVAQLLARDAHRAGACWMSPCPRSA